MPSLRQFGTCTVFYLLSRHTLEGLPAAGLLHRKRGYWAIHSRRHHCLDVPMREDHSRVRTPNSTLPPELIRRVVLTPASAAVDWVRPRRPKTHATTRSFLHRFKSARGGNERRPTLSFANAPYDLDLRT